MPDAIFERRGDAFHATGLARGPWDPNAQHGGAPAALLAGELEKLDPQPHLRIVRITYELLRPVPLGTVHVHTELVRPGKRVQLLEATLTAPDGAELVRARAVRVARAPRGAGTPVEETPAGPETAARRRQRPGARTHSRAALSRSASSTARCAKPVRPPPGSGSGSPWWKAKNRLRCSG